MDLGKMIEKLNYTKAKVLMAENELKFIICNEKSRKIINYILFGFLPIITIILGNIMVINIIYNIPDLIAYYIFCFITLVLAKNFSSFCFGTKKKNKEKIIQLELSLKDYKDKAKDLELNVNKTKENIRNINSKNNTKTNINLTESKNIELDESKSLQLKPFNKQK